MHAIIFVFLMKCKQDSVSVRTLLLIDFSKERHLSCECRIIVYGKDVKKKEYNCLRCAAVLYYVVWNVWQNLNLSSRPSFLLEKWLNDDLEIRVSYINFVTSAS